MNTQRLPIPRTEKWWAIYENNMALAKMYYNQLPFPKTELKKGTRRVVARRIWEAKEDIYTHYLAYGDLNDLGCVGIGKETKLRIINILNEKKESPFAIKRTRKTREACEVSC
ncbi:MAG: hypothetical protein WC533_01395 [Candidatus Pacearchaeota archaeon]